MPPAFGFYSGRPSRFARLCGAFVASPTAAFLAEPRVAVVGGGAAGFFAAIAAAEAGGGPVVILEKSSSLLGKVKISGGGRCNVTHACFDPALLVTRYPRGSRELLGPMRRFGPRDTVEWFEARGVPLKTEGDGRMFPTTDHSETVIRCLLDAATAAGVQILTRAGLQSVERTAEGFRLTLDDGRAMTCAKLILATGTSRAANAGGPAVARAFGHAVSEPVPSLFTFNIPDERLHGLAGVSVPAARVRVPGTSLDETGPVLVTHWGLSGPAVLRLSAWGARELATRQYRFAVRVHWHPARNAEEIERELRAARESAPRRIIAGDVRFTLPMRLWERLVAAAGFRPEDRWASADNARLRALAAQVSGSEFTVTGKSTNKDEFVTCGGVSLRELDFRTMESRLVPGLHFAGELLDVDGVTGGFNFQAAWTTGYLAGHGAAAGGK